MPRRKMLTDRQREALLDLPTDETAMLRHYTLADDDLEIIRARRRPHNRFGFALQLCALRYPGRLLAPGEVISAALSRFLAAQLGLKPDDLVEYATRDETRREHLATLREIYGYKMFTGRGSRDLKAWLENEAETARSNEDLARRFVEQCRATQTILPGITVIERLCADALVAAERRLDTRVADRLDDETQSRLDALLTETVDSSVTRFVWLRQFEVGQNSADMNRLLDRLEFLQGMPVERSILAGVPPHRIARLRRQGERYFAGDLRDISGDRRLAILAVCALEWHSAIADAVVETHDRIVGRTWREAKRACDARADDAKAALKDTCRASLIMDQRCWRHMKIRPPSSMPFKTQAAGCRSGGLSPPLPNSPTHWLPIRWHMLFTGIIASDVMRRACCGRLIFRPLRLPNRCWKLPASSRERKPQATAR